MDEQREHKECHPDCGPIVDWESVAHSHENEDGECRHWNVDTIGPTHKRPIGTLARAGEGRK